MLISVLTTMYGWKKGVLIVDVKSATIDQHRLPVNATQRVFMYCTYGAIDHYMGEIENEGSFAKIAREHEAAHGDDHRGHYYLLFENSPQYQELKAIMEDERLLAEQRPEMTRLGFYSEVPEKIIGYLNSRINRR